MCGRRQPRRAHRAEHHGGTDIHGGLTDRGGLTDHGGLIYSGGTDIHGGLTDHVELDRPWRRH